MRYQRTGIVVAVVVALAGGVLVAGAARADDGAALWEKHCTSCHGADGKGDTKAGKLTKVRDLTAADVRTTLTRDHVRKVAEEGVTDPASGKARMKGYKDKLSAAELDAVTAHVLGLVGAAK